MKIRCFMLKPTERFARSLRRYERPAPDGRRTCPGELPYHDASTPIDVVEVPGCEWEGFDVQDFPRDDPRWPANCSCGYQFRDEDNWQVFTDRIYIRPDTGEEFSTRNAPAGAMWFLPWYDEFYKPQLEHCLAVMTPGGLWIVDSQANNCTIPDDGRQERHHCWVIEGTLPDITAGKRQPTCNAGAGSIRCGSYHGFLRNGYLES